MEDKMTAKKTVVQKEDFSSIDLRNIPLGMQLRDRVSGLTGINIARLEFLNGCIQYGLKGKVGTDGKPVEGIFVDSQQIEVIGQGIAPKQPAAKKDTGGVMPDTPRI